MTAEIAVLNRSAVALAADSYVTVSSPGAPGKPRQSKTYLANKLFTLSKYKPVGIMVYGSAELLGVPWETIVKEYRRQLGDNSFDTIDEYASDLIKWLSSKNPLFNEREQRFHFLIAVASYFDFWIKEEIDRTVKERTEESKTIGRREINAIARQVISEHHDDLMGQDRLSYLPKGFEQRLETSYRDEIKGARETILGGFTLTAKSLKQLTEIAVNYITRDVWPPKGLSGVVISGFGELEKFPAVKAFAAHRVVLGVLIYRNDDHNSANLNEFEPHVTPAVICPFAQRDVVDSFLQGIDAHSREVIKRYLSRVLSQWPDIISQSLPKLSSADRNRLNRRLGKAGADILTSFEDELGKHVRKKHIQPMLDTVSMLPKEELASMAESLVSLTSVKRKMSLDLETVGGPVDVAVITKGDGFVWIYRKHYFKPELNPQFLANYFERTT